MHTDTLIIGGGIAGLACGLELCRSGLSVTVLESSNQLGGRARSWTDEQTGDIVDIGPHILLSEYNNMLHLLDGLGTRNQVIWQTGKFITLVGEPRPVTIRMHALPVPFHFLPSLLALPQVSWKELLTNNRLMWRVLKLSNRDVAQLDDRKAEDYLQQQGVSQHFIDWFWRSACMSIMNVPLEHCSAGALLRFFRFMIGKSGYKIGFPAGGLGDLFAPAAKAQIEAAGGRVLENSAVSAITGAAANEARFSGVQLADGTHLEATTCVAAIPPQQLPDLLPDAWYRDFPVFQELSQFSPSRYVSSYLWFDRKLTREKFWARVWSPDNVNYDSYDLSNIRHGWAQRPSVIASNIVYSQRVENMDDDAIVNATLQELRQFLPAIDQAKLLHARVHHIPMAVPAPFPGAEQLRPDNVTPAEGFYLAGDWTATGLPSSMESAVRSGYLAAEKILALFERPRKIAIAPPKADALVRLIGGR